MQNFRLHPLGEPKHVDGPVNAGLRRLNRIVLVVHWRSGTRQIVDFAHFDIQGEAHVVPDQVKAGMLEEVMDIAASARKEIIHAYDFVAPL